MFVWCEIVCRGCSSSVAGLFVSGPIPRREMKKDALAYGWKFEHGESFCCKYCLEEYEEEENKQNKAK